METTRQQGQAAAPGHRPREDWFSDEYVNYWIEQQDARADERRRQFVMIRALVPKTPEQEFRYIDLGAGPGLLDEMLLEQFPHAQATLVDGSMAMLGEAQRRLARFEDRAEFVQADLAKADWAGALTGPFDLAVSTIALHNLRDPRLIRELYAETYKLIGHGGLFLNLDYVRMARPSLSAFGAWAGRDPEAGFSGARGGAGQPGTVEEHLGWLREAGFACAECFWKEFRVALMGGIRDHLHLPGEEEAAGAGAEHAH